MEVAHEPSHDAPPDVPNNDALAAAMQQLHDSSAREAQANEALAALKREHALLLTALQQAGTVVSIVGEAVALKAAPSEEPSLVQQLQQLVSAVQEGAVAQTPEAEADANGWGFEDGWGDEAPVNGAVDAEVLQQLASSEHAEVRALAAVWQGVQAKHTRAVQDAHAQGVRDTLEKMKIEDVHTHQCTS